MEKYNKEEIELDLIDILYLIKARLWIILLSGILLASLVGLVSKFLSAPSYSSTTKLYILTKSTSITSLADIQMGTQLTQDYMVLVKSRPVVTKVIENLELDMTYEQMSGLISVSNPSDTRILEIRAAYPDAFVAKEIVDEFAVVAIDRIAKIMDTEKPTIVEEGYVAPYASNPGTMKNTILGGLLGAFAAAGIIIVLYLMDDTIKSSEDIEKYLGISTLGLIPMENNVDKRILLIKKKRKKQKVSA